MFTAEKHVYENKILNEQCTFIDPIMLRNDLEIPDLYQSLRINDKIESQALGYLNVSYFAVVAHARG